MAMMKFYGAFYRVCSTVMTRADTFAAVRIHKGRVVNLYFSIAHAHVSSKVLILFSFFALWSPEKSTNFLKYSNNETCGSRNEKPALNRPPPSSGHYSYSFLEMNDSPKEGANGRASPYNYFHLEIFGTDVNYVAMGRNQIAL